MLAELDYLIATRVGRDAQLQLLSEVARGAYRLIAAMTRVAVTGMGLIAPCGDDPHEFFANLVAGRSGIGLLHEHSARLETRIAAQAAFDGSAHFPAPRLRMLDRVSQLALVASRQAWRAAALELADEERATTGVFLGTGMGGAATTDDGYDTLYGQNSNRIKPYTVLMAMNNAAASWIGIEHGLSGPNLTFSTACSSSAVAIGGPLQGLKR